MKKLFITLIILQALLIVIVSTELVYQTFFLENIIYPATLGIALGMLVTWAFGWSVKSHIYGQHKVRIRLKEEQFIALVNGETVSDENSQIILSDIGFERMNHIVREAESKSNFD